MLILHRGDFDGDKAWVCWEPQIVNAFENAPVPAKFSPESLGIAKDNTKVKDLISSPDYVSTILKNGIASALQPNLLGACTDYHEGVSYRLEIESRGSSFGNPGIIKLCNLLAHLVDSSKGGLHFTESDWMDFKRQLGLPYSEPGYKDNPPTILIHSLDKIMAEIKRMKTTSLNSFAGKHRRHDKGYDHTLSEPANAEESDAANEPEVQQALHALKAQLREIREFWNAHAPQPDAPTVILNKPGALNFNALSQQVRDRFELLAPPTDGTHPTLRRWRREHEGMPLSPASSWLRLKASMLYREWHSHSMGRYPLWVCGRELCKIKALAEDAKGTALVRRGIFEMMKVDAKMVKRAEAKRGLIGESWTAEEEEEEGFEDDVEDLMSSRGDE